jgi:hypothetical protein
LAIKFLGASSTRLLDLLHDGSITSSPCYFLTAGFSLMAVISAVTFLHSDERDDYINKCYVE